MSSRVDIQLGEELKKFGIKDATTCFNCGNCTAVCPISNETVSFPRRLVRYAQLGLKEKMLQRPEPWLCYYCGDCSATCPREANPGETMMGLRRYFISQYDWTGLSRKFYTSHFFEIIAILLVAGLVGLGFYLFHGPMLTDRVALNVFAPNRVIEILDLLMAGVLSFLLLSNAWRMFRLIMGKEWKQIPVKFYIQQIREFIVHFLTQKRLRDCDEKDRIPWINHFLIMTGYSSVFLLVVVGIRWFQRDEIYPLYHPIRIVGYYATFAILYGVTYAIIGRLRKSRPSLAHSHATDWLFLILLWLTTFTGILVHFTRLLEMPLSTYYVYVIHLMIAVPMLILEVPFAKWAHQLYRPLVLYLMRVREAAGVV